MRSWRNAVALVGLLVASTVVTNSIAVPSAQAYQRLCGHFASSNVDFENDSTTSTYRSVGDAAAGDWTNTPTPIVFQRAAISVSAFVSDGSYGATGYDGITYLPPCPGGIWAGPTNSYWNDYYTKGYSSNDKIQVMVHELGHALGLAHAGSSTCAGQPIMYFSSSRYEVCGHVVPQSDDINGVNAIY